jgi:hypothetical protein
MMVRGVFLMSESIPAVRILPMSANEKSFRGRHIEEVQAGFFLEELPFPPKCGRFRYPTTGLSAEAGTVVLFQYEAKIIASAVFERRERYEQPEQGYRGALWFDPASIRTFDPVSVDTMRNIWPEFRGFGHVKQHLNPAKYPKFQKHLVAVTAPDNFAPIPRPNQLDFDIANRCRASSCRSRSRA